MITGANLPLTSIHGILHRRCSLLNQWSFSHFLLVEAEAVDELAASTSLLTRGLA